MNDGQILDFYAQMGGNPLLVTVEGEEDIKKIENIPLGKGKRYIFAHVIGTRPQKTPITWIDIKGKMQQVTGRIKKIKLIN